MCVDGRFSQIRSQISKFYYKLDLTITKNHIAMLESNNVLNLNGFFFISLVL